MRVAEKTRPQKVQIASLDNGDVFRDPSGSLYMVVEVRERREVVLLDEGFAVQMDHNGLVEPVSGSFVED